MKKRLITITVLTAVLIASVWFVLGDRAEATPLSADRSASKTPGSLFGFPVYQSTTLYHGGLVCINSTGYAIACADTANLICVGVAQGQSDNSSGSDGDKTVEVITDYVFKFNATSITQAMVGSPMYVKDDNTFDDTSTNLVYAGVLVDYDSATVGWIRIGRGEMAAANLSIIDAAANFTAVNVETALAEIYTSAASTANGLGASLVGIEDSGALTSTDDVEAALAEILQHIQTAQAFIPIGLMAIREATSNDIPSMTLDSATVTAQAFTAFGGILHKTTTPVLEFTNGDTDSALRLNWAASNVDAVVFQTPLPPDLDVSADVVIHLRAAMASTSDGNSVASDCYFNEGDTKVEDVGSVLAIATYHEVTITVAAADVPAGAQTLTCELTPGAHGSDAMYWSALWIEYTRSTLTQ